MKKILILAGILLTVWCCSEDQLDLYDGINSVYFGESPESRNYEDTIIFSFANFNVNDTVVHLKVRALGNASKEDRVFRVELESATGTAGVHYETLKTEYVVPASSDIGFVPVHIYRTADMSDTSYAISLKLLPNDNFQLALPSKVIDKVNNKKKDLSRQVFVFTNRIKEPTYWGIFMQYGIGYWSTTKFMYVNSLLDINPADWYGTTAMNFGRVAAISNLMKNHLTEKINQGWEAAVRDPKGPKGYMTVSGVLIPENFPDVSKEK